MNFLITFQFYSKIISLIIYVKRWNSKWALLDFLLELVFCFTERHKLSSRNKTFCGNSALDWRSRNLSTSEILPLKAGNYDKLIHLLFFFFFFELSCSFPYMLIVPTTVVGNDVVAAGSNGDPMHLGCSISQQKLLCWLWLVHCKTVLGLLAPLFPLLLPHQLTAFSVQIQTENQRHQFILSINSLNV